MKTCPTFEAACRQAGLFSDVLTEQLYSLTSDLTNVTDEHVEAIVLPPAVANASNVPLATFLARKCLALTLQSWRDQSAEPWTLALVRYQ